MKKTKTFKQGWRSEKDRKKSGRLVLVEAAIPSSNGWPRQS